MNIDFQPVRQGAMEIFQHVGTLIVATTGETKVAPSGPVLREPLARMQSWYAPCPETSGLTVPRNIPPEQNAELNRRLLETSVFASID
jgi:hypothetical protein